MVEDWQNIYQKNTEALKTSNMSKKEEGDIKFDQTKHLSNL